MRILLPARDAITISHRDAISSGFIQRASLAEPRDEADVFASASKKAWAPPAPSMDGRYSRCRRSWLPQRAPFLLIFHAMPSESRCSFRFSMRLPRCHLSKANWLLPYLAGEAFLPQQIDAMHVDARRYDRCQTLTKFLCHLSPLPR